MINRPASEFLEPGFARYSINYFRYYNYAVWQDLTDLVALSDIAGVLDFSEEKSPKTYLL